MTQTTNARAIAPSAARLTGSLRDVGYNFQSAVADLIDNSITAGATQIDVTIEFNGADSRVFIADDGCGMNAREIDEAMRFGTKRTYSSGDLGRYGLGLKTASLSQARRIAVVSLTDQPGALPEARQLDLDFVQTTDAWMILDIADEPIVERALDCLVDGSGTVVIWENLDRMLPPSNPQSAWARKRLDNYAERLRAHLAMVFHRFLDGTPDVPQVQISVNGAVVTAWDPFARSESGTEILARQRFEFADGHVMGTIDLQSYILPARDNFSSPEEFERASGPLKWNRQQGLYIYRANRLIQWGGWAGLRSIDEHTKLARASLDFGTELDETFNINVAKMRLTLPAEIRKVLTRPINELALQAGAAYRLAAREAHSTRSDATDSGSIGNGAEIGFALKSAALRSGNIEALEQISALLRSEMPELAKQLGL